MRLIRALPLRRRIALGSQISLAIIIVSLITSYVMYGSFLQQSQRFADLNKSSVKIARIQRSIDSIMLASRRYLFEHHSSALMKIEQSTEVIQTSISECQADQCLGAEDSKNVLYLGESLNEFLLTFAEVQLHQGDIEHTLTTELSPSVSALREILSQEAPTQTTTTQLVYRNLLKELTLLHSGIRLAVRAGDTGNFSNLEQRLKGINSGITALSKLETQAIKVDFQKATEQLQKLQASFDKIRQQSLAFQMLVNVVLAGRSSEMQYRAQNVSDILAVRIAEQEDRLQQSTRETYLTMSLLGLMALVLLLLVSVIITASITEPISSITNIFRRLSNGIEEEFSLETSHDDEIAALLLAAESFRKTNLNVKRLLEKSQNQAQLLEAEVQARTSQLMAANAQLATAMRELQDTQENIIQTEKMAALGVMTAGTAHEINNPLMGILNYVEYAQKHSTDPKVLKVLEKTQTAISRIMEIVRNMLTFSHSGSYGSGNSDVTATINIVLSLLQNEINRQQIEFTLQIEPELPPTAMSPDALSQCMVNLLSNAVQALSDQDEKRIVVKAQHKEDLIIIEVIDTGPGIDSNIIDKIFDPFFTTKAVGKGTGLGLSLVRNFVERYGGTAEAENRPNGGAILRLRLPVASD